MSLEIPQDTIAEVYSVLGIESTRDWSLVVGVVMEAELAGKYTDGAFVEELSDMRWQQALDYNYPVPNTGPTRASSLRIVKDILTIRNLENTREDREESVAVLGMDTKLANADGLERSHRLWEKGILRILDPHTSRTMWSVEFDDSLKASPRTVTLS